MGILDIFAGTAKKAYNLHRMGNVLYDQGKSAEAKAKHEEALALYEKAMQEKNVKPVFMMAYGVLLLRFFRFDEAKALFLKAEKAPGITKQEKSQLRINYAICQWKLGNLDSAIEQLKIALSESKTGMLYGSLGYILIEKAKQTGDFTEAVEFNAQALDYDNEDAVILDNLGQLNLAMGDKEKALEYFTKAHEAKPKQVDTLYYLAVLANEKGDSAKAKEYLNTALNEGNYSALCTTTKAQAQELLDSLK